MGRTYTRQEIYDMVWLHPRTTLAKQLNVSDVWIGKQCAYARIPVPPAGHWARQLHGKPTVRPPLPLRLPGGPRFFSLGDGGTTPERSIDTDDLNELIAPPTFDENIDEQVKLGLAAIGPVKVGRDLSAPHKSLSRVLAAEQRKRTKAATSSWSWDKPLFDGPTHQRHLRIFNGLAHAFGRIAASSEVRDTQEWLQGTGTVHQLRLRIDFGGSTINLYIAEPSDVTRSKGLKPPPTATLRIEGNNASTTEEWADAVDSRLERQLDDVVRALLYRAETGLREHSQRHYEWRVGRQKERLKQIEQQRVEAERKRIAALEARQRQIREGIVALAADRRTAEDIRSMVEALRTHPDQIRESSPLFEAWSAEAHAVANLLDPLERPLEVVLAAFKLKDTPLGTL